MSAMYSKPKISTSKFIIQGVDTASTVSRHHDTDATCNCTQSQYNISSCCSCSSCCKAYEEQSSRHYDSASSTTNSDSDDDDSICPCPPPPPLLSPHSLPTHTNTQHKPDENIRRNIKNHSSHSDTKTYHPFNINENHIIHVKKLQVLRKICNYASLTKKKRSFMDSAIQLHNVMLLFCHFTLWSKHTKALQQEKLNSRPLLYRCFLKWKVMTEEQRQWDVEYSITCRMMNLLQSKIMLAAIMRWRDYNIQQRTMISSFQQWKHFLSTLSHQRESILKTLFEIKSFNMKKRIIFLWRINLFNARYRERKSHSLKQASFRNWYKMVSSCKQINETHLRKCHDFMSRKNRLLVHKVLMVLKQHKIIRYRRRLFVLKLLPIYRCILLQYMFQKWVKYHCVFITQKAKVSHGLKWHIFKDWKHTTQKSLRRKSAILQIIFNRWLLLTEERNQLRHKYDASLSHWAVKIITLVFREWKKYTIIQKNSIKVPLFLARQSRPFLTDETYTKHVGANEFTGDFGFNHNICRDKTHPRTQVSSTYYDREDPGPRNKIINSNIGKSCFGSKYSKCNFSSFHHNKPTLLSSGYLLERKNGQLLEHPKSLPKVYNMQFNNPIRFQLMKNYDDKETESLLTNKYRTRPLQHLLDGISLTNENYLPSRPRIPPWLKEELGKRKDYQNYSLLNKSIDTNTKTEENVNIQSSHNISSKSYLAHNISNLCSSNQKNSNCDEKYSSDEEVPYPGEEVKYNG